MRQKGVSLLFPPQKGSFPTISWEAGSPSEATSTISVAKLQLPSLPGGNRQQLSSPAYLRASRAFRASMMLKHLCTFHSRERGGWSTGSYPPLGLGTLKGGVVRRKSPVNAANNHNSNMCPAFTVHGTVQKQLTWVINLEVILTTAPWGSLLIFPFLQMRYRKAKELA